MTTDAQLLAALRRNGDEFVTATELSRRLGLSRPLITGRLKALRELGYELETSPVLGWRLRGGPEALHADDLLSRLPRKRVIGRDVRVFAATTSTNDVCERLARDGVPEGVVVLAEAQTRGRGRLGRKWVSPPRKGLWLSVLLRPPWLPTEVTRLTVVAATALARAVERRTGVRPDIKWPNDLLCHGRKLAGILTEMSAEADRVRHVVVGLGLNVNQAVSDFPPEVRPFATSLKLETGAHASRAELAAAVLEELDRDYARVCGGGFAALADEWEARCATLGQHVTVTCGSRRVRGRAEALDDDGALLLRTEHGRLERILGGDVTLEKP